MTVAVLFARADSVYKRMAGTDVFDVERDARTWAGGSAVVAHPPCRAWGRLRTFAKPRDDEKDLALFAVRQVRKEGGCLEHPAGSLLWEAAVLPYPGQRDAVGGFTYPINQNWFGHRATKPTWLYIVGLEPGDLPPVPFVLGEGSHIVGGSRFRDEAGKRRPDISKAEREHTPPVLAAWLVYVAQLARIALEHRAAAGGAGLVTTETSGKHLSPEGEK